MDISVKVDDGKVVIALGAFAASLQDKQQLLKTIGDDQLVSIRRTFAEQGSPSGSWVPLSPNTIKRDPKRYGAGHKLLIQRGRLLNSIKPEVQGNAVVIGTNAIYAGVHQYGSRDRGVGMGPQARLADRAVQVDEHGRIGVRRKGKVVIVNSAGREQTVTRNIPGPLQRVMVSKHQRFQNIPARPYLVFRPEDPARIGSEVRAFVVMKAKQAGLGGA